MADTYLAISQIAGDPDMLERVRACAAQQAIDGPEAWAYDQRYSWAAQPGWGAQWDSGLAAHPADPDYRPGADPAVITDGNILSAVQLLAGAG